MRSSLAKLAIGLWAFCFSVSAGSAATSFSLQEIHGGRIAADTGSNRATAFIFVSSVCPMSTDYGSRIARIWSEYGKRGVRVFVVNSNQNEPDSQVERQRKNSDLPFPIYRDPDGKIADLLHVYATPTAVLLDSSASVRYFGKIDDARNPARVARRYLERAVEALLSGKDIEPARTAVLGCSIKSSTDAVVQK